MPKPSRRERPNQKKCCDSNLKSGPARRCNGGAGTVRYHDADSWGVILSDLEIEVLSMPSWEAGLDSDLHRMKSGLLYGDTVTIRSLPLASTYYAARIAHGGLSDREVFEELRESAQYVDDDAFAPQGKQAAIAVFDQYIAALEAAESGADKVALAEIHEAADGLRSAQMEDFGQTGALRAGIEIADAETKGLVSVRRMHGISAESELEAAVTGMQWWEDEVGKALDNPNGLVFADETAIGIIAASGRDSGASVPGAQRVKAAQLAGQLFQRLPLLPYASIDELIDVRSRLQAPLTRFRAEMLRAGAELESQPYTDDLFVEIDNYIVKNIEPSVLEIEEAFSTDAYLSELALRGGSALGKYLAPGSALAVAIVSGNVLAALSVGGVAALGLGAAAMLDVVGTRSQAKKSGLFFYQQISKDYRA